MKKQILPVFLIFISVLAVDTIYVGELQASDPNSVQKWETWDSDLNVTGGLDVEGLTRFNTSRVYVGDVRTIGWLDPTALGAEPGHFGFCDNNVGTTCAAFGSTVPDSGTSLAAFNIGDEIGATNSPFAVARFGQYYGVENNTGSLAIFYHWAGQGFPIEAVQIRTNDPYSSDYVLKVNGLLLPDAARGVLYIQNDLNRTAIEVANSTKISTNLNADLLDSYEAEDLIRENVQVETDLIPDGNKTRNIGNSSNYWNDGYFDNLIVNTDVETEDLTVNGEATFTNNINAPNIPTYVYDDDEVWINGNLHVGGQFKFNNTNFEQDALIPTAGQANYDTGIKLPKNTSISSATMTITGGVTLTNIFSQGASSNSPFGIMHDDENYLLLHYGVSNVYVYNATTLSLIRTSSAGSTSGNSKVYVDDDGYYISHTNSSAGNHTWYYLNGTQWTTYSRSGFSRAICSSSNYVYSANGTNELNAFYKTNSTYAFTLDTNTYSGYSCGSNTDYICTGGSGSVRCYWLSNHTLANTYSFGSNYPVSLYVSDSYAVVSNAGGVGIISLPDGSTQTVSACSNSDQVGVDEVNEIISCGKNWFSNIRRAYNFDGTLIGEISGYDMKGTTYLSNRDSFIWATNEVSTMFEDIVIEPSNVTIDVGIDGTYDYTGLGYLTNDTVDLNITAINNYLNSCSEDSKGLCTVPMEINSTTAGVVVLSNLTVLFESDIYADNVYANQFYGRNSTTILSFDNPLDDRFDSELAKSITVENKDGVDIFKMPDELYTWINGERYFDYNKWWSWLTGAIKEYAYRIDEVEAYEDRIAYLEAEVQYLKDNCMLKSEVKE